MLTSAKKSIYQYGVYPSLLQGFFYGEHTISQLREYGNFGIGTYEGLDGELILLKGEFYQIKEDGKVYVPFDFIKVPFIQMTWFEPGEKIDLPKKMHSKGIEKFLLGHFSKNHPVAFKIDALLSHAKLRSFPKQEERMKQISIEHFQTIFPYDQIKGTILGFFMPPFLSSFSSKGVHAHFISHDREVGGHLLEAVIEKGEVLAQSYANLNLELPKTSDFL